MAQRTAYTFFQRVRGFLELMRPLEWDKTIFAMIIALLIVFYVYSAAVSLGVFFAGVVSVILLWSGLYTLNDYTDRECDALHKSKYVRPIPSKRVSPSEALLFSIGLVFISLLIAFFLGNALFFGCLIVMFLNQLAYTLKPLRLKERKVFDIISGAFINPIFRYLAGFFLFVSFARVESMGFAILPVLFILGIQVGSYLTYRFSSREHDEKMKMKSTVMEINQRQAKFFSRVLLCIAAFSMIGMFLNYGTFKLASLGFVPFEYILAIVPGIVLLPFARQILRSPSKATAPENYKSFYAFFHVESYLMILVGLLVFVFFA
ncbi:MAG: UbiA prenyltransferase family protein [Candidatus Diapherotrites archaeon]|nr:UbiA prenyltransferase family protein [Candidatus Diapherotrites archaeon]